jgi:hypothetical protein
MPRRVKYHPSTMPKAVSGGEPEDGQSWNQVADDDDDDVEVASDESGDLKSIRAELDRLREENSLIRRAMPPAEPARSARQVDEVDEMSDEDFDALLFSNPREAMRLNNERVKAELRNEYTANQGTTKFWDQFYQANGDLRGDDDLVQSTLNKNMAELGNMPVEAAMERLAALTRDRILGFIKKRKEPRTSRAVAEGANAPVISAASVSDPKPTTLSNILRARHERRHKTQTA